MGWDRQRRDAPENVFSIDGIPHSWLFPRMDAAVHHGGAGTTGPALAAGVPSIITPLAADQYSWGRTVHHLGAGPAPIPFSALTAQRLATAIRRARIDPSIQH